MFGCPAGGMFDSFRYQFMWKNSYSYKIWYDNEIGKNISLL